MTRTFNEKIRCPQCGCEHTVESDFERWFRNHKDLHSAREGLVRFDLDVLLHKYKTCTDGKGSRDIQCMMFIEVKTYMATPSPAQSDTLYTLNQILRNRRPNIHSTPKWQIKGQMTRVWSKYLNRNTTLKLYGGHMLQMDGTFPDNSSMIMWDHQVIDERTLMELLRFERDPDRIEMQLDHRRRSCSWKRRPMLPGMDT